MDAADRQATAWGVLFAALLHLGLLVFLLLATLSCNTWERAIDSLGLPKSWNPVTCQKPLTLAGPVIEATLMGPAGAPLPPPAKVRFPRPKPPPPPKREVHAPKPKPVPVKTLPPPPKNPDTIDRQKAVALASNKAKLAQQKQRERQRQRMSELDANSNAKIDKLFQQMEAAGKSSQRADREAQKLAQLKDLKHSQAVPTTAPRADQARSGQGGQDTALQAQWLAAIQAAVTQSWLRPDNLPHGVVCPVDITQIPGGSVINVHVESGCPYDEVGRKSIQNAVMRAQPLPYQGYEKVFKRQITLNFQVKD